MSISRTCFAVAIILGLSAPVAWGQLADPDAQTMYLGKVEVKGQKDIFRTLQQIKVALKRPISVDAADAQTVVCRLLKPLGQEDSEYLDCATNRDLTKQRDATRLRMLTTFGDPLHCSSQCSEEIWLQHLIAVQPDSELRMRVDGHAFRKLMASLPLPADTTVAAPSSASQPSN
jgi:hypothetical protein